MAIMRFSVFGLLVIWFAPGECIGRNHVDHHSTGEILRSKKAFYFFPHDYHDAQESDTTPPGRRRVEEQVDDDDAVWSPPASGYCEQEAAKSSSPNTTCTCNAFDDGVVELSCLENCLYCGKTESSSCGQFSSATNLTDGLAFNIISYATRFRYDGTGGRNELISVEEIDCNGIGDCTACRVLVNGTQCNSCTLCSSGAGAIVDCENIVEGSSFNSCVSPPGPGLFEGFFDYDVVECVVPPPPPNDNCTSAIPIVPGDVVSGTLTGALEDNVSSCRTFDTGSHGVWYSFEGTGTPVLLSTCSESNTNSVGLVSVHQGSGCDLLECSDGSSQFYCSGYSGGSSMLVPTEAGATYYVFVSGWDGSFGNFDLSLTAFPEQSNNKCPAASEISVDGGPVVATIDFRESQRARLGVCSLDVVENYGIAWYRFEAVQDATIRASTCTTTGNTGTVGWMSTITITSGACEALACIEQSELHAYYETCSDGGTYVDFTVAAGNGYGVAVWGSGYADVGLLELEIRTLNPPSNDNCQGAQLINVTSNFTGVFRDVTLSSEESIGVCFEQIGTSKSGGIWYSFVGTGDVIVATACSNDFTPYLTMHTGSCSDLECVSPATWNAPSSCSSFLYGQQSVPVETVDGTVYYVLVSGSGPISGSFGLSFRTVLPVENDSCSNAIEVKADGQVIIGNTEGAIYEEFTNDCPYTSSSPGVWYSVVGDGGMLKADTCSPVTNFDTAISVYRGSCEDLQCVGTNDDGCQSLSSSFTWSTEAGETYYILVSGLSDEQTGDYGFKVAPFVPASNDECAGAINVAVGGVLTGTMKGASSYNESYACYSGYDRPTLWYTIEGTGTALKVSTCAPNSTFYGGIQAFEGTSCSDLECSGLIYEGGGYSDYDCTYPSAATFFFAEEGVQYSIMLIDDSFGGENSTFSLTVTEIDLAPNDECETASLIGVTENEVIQGSTIKSLPDNVTCDYYNSNAPGVWYSVMGTGNTLVASTCSRPIHFDGSIFVFSGACGAQECVAVGPSGYGSCGDSFNAGSRVPFRTQVGVEYYILVTGSYPSAVGDFSLSLSDAISPPNDVCSDAISVTPDSGVIKGSLTNATSLFGSNYSCAYDQTAVTVWYSVMGTGDVLVISTCSDQLNFDSAISVSTGTCDDQRCVTFNAYACTETSFSGARVSVRTEVGVEYFIAVEGLNFPSRGDFALTVSTLQAPINDECPGAIALQPDEGAITRSIANATGYLDYNSSICSYNYDAPDVWYSMIGTGEVLLLSTCSSVLNFDTSLSVSKGSCDRLECVVYDTYGYSGCTESTYIASRAVFRTEAGVEYFIAVQGVNYPLEGEFTLELSTVQPPVNDECSGAIMIQPANKTIIGSLANATGTLGFNTSCEYSSGSPGIWYSMIGTGDVYSISTCSSDLTVDTALSVSTGSCGNQTCIVTGAYNEYDCTETSYSAARVIFRTEVGVKYFIQVQGLTASAQGRFALDMSMVVAPVNDACLDATSISTETVSGSITNATDFDGFINYCSYSFGAPDVWYKLMGTGEAFAVSTCSSVLDFDAALTVSTGSCINQTCITSGAYNYQTCEIGSYSAARVVFRTEVGVEYFISVQGANYPTEGKFELQISTIEIPNNDECIDALAIVPGEGPIFGSTSVATYDGTNSSCSGYDTSPDLWYRVEGTGKKLSASTCGVRTNYDSLVSIFEAVGEECDTTCIETSNEFCGSGSKVEWFVNEGVTYYIRVHGYSTSSGSFVLRLTSA